MSLTFCKVPRHLVAVFLCAAATLLMACGTSDADKAAFAKFEQQAIELLPKAQAGDLRAQRQLCSLYYYSKVGASSFNNEQAMRWCLPSARAGNAWAEYHVAKLLRYRYREDYLYYPEYQAVKDHKGRIEFALFWYKRSAEHGDADAQKAYEELNAWYQGEFGSAKSNWMEKAFIATAGAAIIAKAPSSLSSAEKVQLSTGYVSDVMADGGGSATKAASSQIQATRASASLAQTKSTSAVQRTAGGNTATSTPQTALASKAPSGDAAFCGPLNKCLVGDGISFCAGPYDPAKAMCKSECLMDKGPFYHDVTLPPGAYLPGDYRCPAKSCNVVHKCN
jgi:hypothetical protein